jgi:DNA (cytosine-5)-methyltransferase 1
MGLHQAGFDVIGVDIEQHPRYPFAFIQGDALEPPVRLEDFDLIWASPPCQGFTAYKRRVNHVRPREDLIPETRAMLRSSGRPYIIENVPGAPLISPTLLCGSMFGLDVRRHRMFETSFFVMAPSCQHGSQRGDFPHATNRTNRRKTAEIGAWRIPLATQRRAMGIPWMELEELSEAIPPAYAEFLARQALAAGARLEIARGRAR